MLEAPCPDCGSFLCEKAGGPNNCLVRYRNRSQRTRRNPTRHVPSYRCSDCGGWFPVNQPIPPCKGAQFDGSDG